MARPDCFYDSPDGHQAISFDDVGMGFHKQETLSTTSDAYGSLRKFEYHNLMRYTTEVKFFFFLVDNSLSGLCLLDPSVHLRQRHPRKKNVPLGMMIVSTPGVSVKELPSHHSIICTGRSVR